MLFALCPLMAFGENLLKNIKGFPDPEEGRRLYEIALDAGQSRSAGCLSIAGIPMRPHTRITGYGAGTLCPTDIC